VTEALDIELMKDEWETSVDKDPAMKLQLWCIRDLFRLLMNRDFLIKLKVVHV
jgi:hypothetical protein